MKRTPDKLGHFGIYGGRYISETLMPAVQELEEAYNKWRVHSDFKAEFVTISRNTSGGRHCSTSPRLTEDRRGRHYLKREDLCHNGATR